jgi:hypothetical protein
VDTIEQVAALGYQLDQRTLDGQLVWDGIAATITVTRVS